jgi:hypothetical protein
VRCLGDPHDGTDCLCPSVAFAFAALPDDQGRPLIVAFPFCEAHQHLVVDFVGTYTPLDEFEVMPIEWLDEVQTLMAQDGDELWLYERNAA